MESGMPYSTTLQRAVVFLALLTALAAPAGAQEQMRMHLPDSFKISLQNIRPDTSLAGLSMYHIPRPEFITPDPVLPSLFLDPPRQNIDIIAPWKLQLANAEKHRTMYTILASVQVGGVAYLAYRHIKKYGLW